METVHSENYKGYEIEIYQSEEPDNPNEWNDDIFLVYDHRDFFVKKEGFDPTFLYEEIWNKNKFTYQGYWVLGVEAYIHSGVSLALKGSKKAAMFPDRRWDVSFKGFILVKRTKGTWTSEAAIATANASLKDWNNYLSGNIYGYEIEELGESCGGYYGDYNEGALKEAREIIDYVLKEKNNGENSLVETADIAATLG